MKLSQRKWKTLVSGVLLTISASSVFAMPAFAAEYSNGLTGVVNDDEAIISTGGSTVTLSGDTITYDFQGKDHIFTVKNADAITTDGTENYNYVYNNVDSSGKNGTLHLYQSNDLNNPWAGVTGFVAAGGKVIVNSNLDITATSEYSSAGITAENKANLIINGNVKMRKDNPESPWGIITDNVHGNIGPGGSTSMGGDGKYTGARWQPTGISVGNSRGDITINGDVDIAVRGTAVRTDAYEPDGDIADYDLGTISLLGKSTRIDTPYREENFVEGFGKFIEPYYSLASYGGTINVNVKDQKALDGKVEIVGNVLAMKASDEAGKAMVYQDGRINLGLTTQDSSWKGIIDNAGAEKAGEVNLWLQNGAQWIYENASRKDGLDAANMPDYSRPYYEKYDGISHLSSLVGGKDKASAGIIKVNDNDPIHIANAEGVTKVWYDHADATPGTIIGGDVKVFGAKEGTEMMLYTGNNGITKGFDAADTAAEKNNVSEVLNSLAHKLWYMAGDTNLKGSVSIAEGLTASSVTMKTGNITFAEGGQGFYDYTPEKDDKTYVTGPIVKSENIGETRESDVNGVVSINVNEAQTGVSGDAPSALYVAGEAVSPLVVDLQGHTLKLNANNQTANYVSTVFVDANKSMEIKDSKGNGVLKVSAGLDADGNTDTKAKYVYGIRVCEGGSLTADTDVEIDGVKSNSSSRAFGVYAYSEGNVVFEKDLTIKNVHTANKVGPYTAGIYADASSSAKSPINITVKGNLNIENVVGSAIRVMNSSTVSTAGATIKAPDMSNGTEYSQYFALQANKGTINLNTSEGITAGILDVTGDMKVTNNKESVINVNMTKGSQWTGAVSNIPSSTYNAPDGQFNLTMAEGSVWNHETGLSTDTLKRTDRSNVSKLDGSGVIYQNSDKGITVYNYSGDTTVVYGHDANNPQNITGGDFTVKTAAAGSKITLVTDSQGITGGFDASDTAAEKNNVKEVLNKLANKLFYTGYKDANLSGVVKIADGLTASSLSASVKASGDITFSDGSNGTKKAGQGFYDYTPEVDKPDYKTGAITTSENISLNREVDEKGVAHINVTESNAGNNKFASALYAGEESSPSKPMTVNLSGKGLALNAAQTSGQAAAIYAGANAHIKVVNQSANQKLAITANNTDTRGAHGIYADGSAHLNISGPVEITDVVTKGDAATGINIQGKQSEINIDGSLTISNVKGIRERGKGINAAGILVTGDTSTVAVSGPVDISGVRGSGILLKGKDTKVFVGGGNITAAEDSDKSHNFYAVRVEKGTLDINMKDGAAGSTTTKITGDMYATGQYGKKVVEYTGGELIDWNDAGVLNVALTDKDSFWKGVAAYEQYNSDYGSGGNTMHDIGQFNLYLQNGAAWTNEQQSHVTSTTIKNGVWEGSTLASLHGGKDAANAGLIYQKDNNPISVVNYSGHTTVFYEHDAADPTKIIGGDFNITKAEKGSAITFITDNKGITSGFNDSDTAEAKDNVASVLNNLAGKLFYHNYTDGNLQGVVKIADGLTASSAALKTGDISFSTDATGTKKPGQGYYDYKPSGEKPEYKTGAIKESEDISKTREADANGVVKVKVTEPTITEGYSKFAAALYADDSTASMNVKMAGKDLSLSSVVGAGAQAAGVFVDEGANITIANPFVKQKLAITATNNDTYGAYGIFAKGDNAKLNISGPVEITNVTTKGSAVGGIVVRGQNTDVVIDGPLKISNVKAESDNAIGYNGFGIGVTGVGSTVAINGTVDISGIHGSAILLKESGNKVSIGGGNIAAAVDSDKSHNYYAARVEKGTLDINMKDGVAGDTTTTITGDMYINCLHGMKPPSLGSEELVEFKEEGVLNVALTNADSYWKGVAAHEKYKTDKHQYGYDLHDVGDLNLYLQNGATWTNEQQSHATTTTVRDGIWDGSTLASLHGGKDAAHAGHIFQNDSKNITINNYSGNTNIYYAHTGNGEAAENYAAGDTIIKSAAAGSVVSLITDNKDVAMGNSESVAKVLNALAGKLTYSNFATEKNLKGVVKIAGGLTASGAELKKGDISFSTETTGTKTPGQGYYEYDEVAENTFNAPITGGTDKKYTEAGIEKEKGVYTFTNDAVIDVTKGDYSSNLGAIESSGGPVTINADGLNLEVSYHVTKGSNVARAVATGNSFGKSKDITIKAKSLKLSTDTTGFYGQGVYADGGKITIDADTTISTSAQNESNGIYSGSGATVNMNGSLDIKKDSKAANYIALKSDNNGVINVNIKDGKAGAGVVKIDGDVYTKSAESYDYWEDETTTTSSTVNLALRGADSTWNGRSIYEATSSGDDSTSYGSFNLWLTEGASWTNEKNGKVVPKGFAGSHVTNFVGGADEAHAGNIFQNDSKSLTIDKYSGNTNIFYAHEGNGEAAENYKAGDTVIKSAATGSAVSLITDNKGVSMDNKDSVANVLNALAGKLTYSNFATGEKNLTGVVKIAAGLTASSAALETGDITFTESGKGTYVKPEPVDDTHFTEKITGAMDQKYVDLGIEKEQGVYTFVKDTVIDVTKGKDTAMVAIGSKGGPVTINADGKTLDVSFHSDKTFAARAIASETYYGGKPITIKAGKLNLNAEAVDGESQGIFAKVGSTITIDADTTITTSSNKESNGIYAGSRGVVNMNGNLEIKEDTKAKAYYALKADGSGVINVNIKDNNAGDNVVKFTGDIYAKTNESSINLALKGKDSQWTGRSLNESADIEKRGNFNLWLTDGASWTNQVTGKSVPSGFAGSHVTNFVGGADEAHAGNIFQNDSKSLTIDKYSGNTNIFYAHEGNGEAAENYKAGDTVIKSAATGSAVSLITDNKGVSMDNKDSVANVLNALAGKLTYSNFATGEKNLTGVVKIADGLTASSAALETGDITFTEKGKGTYVKPEPVDDTHFTEKITGGLDQKYVDLGIEKEQGVYTFVKDTVIDVTKGKDTAMVAIGSKGGPVTINAEGKTLDVSFHSDKTFAARAIASETYYGGKPITIKAGKLNLNAEAVDGESQGIFAKVGSTITIDADTTITTSSNKESNGIYAGSRGVVNMNGNLEIKEDTKAKAYYALKADGTGVINVNIKDNNAGDNVVKFNGDIYAKDKESSINLALKGADSIWTGSSMNESADSEKHGSFNLWLTDGASWTNQVTGKDVPAGFAGSHVTSFVGGASAAAAGNIFQNDSKNLTIDNYSGNTNIFYAHTGNGEAASDFAAGDTVIKHAAEGSVVSMITDNSGISMDNEYSVANVLNNLAGKLTYSNFANEKNLTGYVKIADGLTASSAAMQTGNIAFNAETGKGSLENGSLKPGFTYPDTQKPESTKPSTGITGDGKADYEYKQNGILKEEGNYVFTQDPTEITVTSGAAVDASRNVKIDTTQAKLILKGASAGINTNGNDVTVKGNTEISGVIGINAASGNVTLNGSTNITGNDGKGVAINASNGGNVTIDSGNSAVNINGKINADNGSIMIDSGNATGKITGDVKAVNNGSVEISLNDKASLLKGGYKVDGNSSIVMNIKNGATWEVEDYKETPAAYRMARARLAPAAAGAVTGLIINGGATEGEAGNIKINSTSNLDAASWSGWENVLYTHTDKGANVDDYVTEAGAKAGNVIVNSAKEGSGVVLFTDNKNINVNDKAEVEAALTALAQKAQYTDHAANGANLKGKVRIVDGLTSGSRTGEMKWNAAGAGEFDPSSIKWSEIIEGDYETLVMQGVRSAATTSMHTWRDNMQDTYTGADLADADGIFAKALGGKTSSDVHGLKDSNNYRGVQVGFDKVLANGWHAGVAFDYRDGDSNYLLGGKGDNQMYSFGVYGVKSFADQSYLRVAAKAGRVENEYDVYNEIRSLKLHGDYKSNAYGLTMEYGKTFGTETNYFTPKAQLTWSQVGSKDYAAHTPNDTMYIDQDAYSSFVGRLGVEAGMKSAKGSVYVGLFAAHEFNGDISASYFAKDGGSKYTSFDGKDTWMEMKLGGTYDFSNTAHLYADIAKDFGGDFERKWKLNAGIRFEF